MSAADAALRACSRETGICAFYYEFALHLSEGAHDVEEEAAH